MKSVKKGGDDDKPAEEVFKNIQVLKGIPSGQLKNVMQFMRASLNVNCGFCHVHNDVDHTWDFASDSVEEKNVARKMIDMVKSINTAHFEGNTSVTCFTCHNGSEHPMRTPTLPQHMAEKETIEHPEKLPEVSLLFSNYEKAVNNNKPEELKTKYSKGTVTGMDGKAYPVEIYQQAPNKYLSIVTTPEGKSYKGFDGTTGWMKNNSGVKELSGFGLQQVKDFADFYGDMNLAQKYTDTRFIGTDTANGSNCYVLRCIVDDKVSVRLYFDIQSGMLSRKNVYTKSILGNIPERTDYLNYSGSDLKYPSVMNFYYLDPWSESQRNLTEVKYNVPLDGIDFTMPAK
ncbi:MAG: c-type cytochrome [Ignavibacteria bacterium]